MRLVVLPDRGRRFLPAQTQRATSLVAGVAANDDVVFIENNWLPEAELLDRPSHGIDRVVVLAFVVVVGDDVVECAVAVATSECFESDLPFARGVELDLSLARMTSRGRRSPQHMSCMV